jgi:hypothetical protein
MRADKQQPAQHSYMLVALQHVNIGGSWLDGS